MKEKTKAIPAEKPAIELPPTPDGGLSAAEAERRFAAGLSNRQTQEPGKSVPQIVAENLFTLFNLLNFALAFCLALVGSWRNMLFLGVVFSNTLIGTVQSLRARRMLNKLRLLQERPAHPLRDGVEQSCPPDALVLGDLAIFRIGDQIPADCVVRKGLCAANESLLTGESDPIPKQPGDELRSGSFLTEGRVVAELTAVGDNAYAAKLTRDAKQIRQPKSELMTELNRLVVWVSRLLVPLGLLLFAKEYFLQKAPIDKAVPEAVAAMIGMIPEGLILLTSVALLAGVVKLGRRQTLVQELYGIETLARADVLCVDKTGTLTTGEMTLERMIPLEANADELEAKAARFLAAFEAGSGTLRALEKALPKVENTAEAVLPFSSARKKSAASYPDGTTLILGAPSFVTGGQVPAQAAEETEKGFRVLLLAEADGRLEGDTVPPVSRLLGLVLLRDTLRKTAAQTLQWFHQQDVSVRVLSGDDPRTVAATAGMLGLEGCEHAVDCGKLSDEDLAAAADGQIIFGRLTPERKRILVEAMKQAGHTVAMTGDGVNDIPSLKASDCSIAIAGGADATEHAAQLVLLDGDFQSLPAVVAEGRRVIGNITRTASLFLVKTLFSFLLSVLLLFLPLRYPFQPIQLTLVSALTVGVPGFFLALERSSERAGGHFLLRILLRALPGALAVCACAIASMLSERAGVPHELCSTMAALGAGVIGLCNLALICHPFTPLRWAVCGAMTVGFAGAVLLFPGIFLLEIGTMGGADWLRFGLFTAGGLAILLLGTLALKPVREKLK